VPHVEPVGTAGARALLLLQPDFFFGECRKLGDGRDPAARDRNRQGATFAHGGASRRSFTVISCSRGRIVTAGEELALADEPEKVVSGLRGGRLGRQPPPACRELRYSAADDRPDRSTSRPVLLVLLLNQRRVACPARDNPSYRVERQEDIVNYKAVGRLKGYA
jgi:hypothetical protein